MHIVTSYLLFVYVPDLIPAGPERAVRSRPNVTAPGHDEKKIKKITKKLKIDGRSLVCVVLILKFVGLSCRRVKQVE